MANHTFGPARILPSLAQYLQFEHFRLRGCPATKIIAHYRRRSTRSRFHPSADSTPLHLQKRCHLKEESIDADLAKMVAPISAGKVDESSILIRDSASPNPIEETVNVTEKAYFDVKNQATAKTNDAWIAGSINSMAKSTNSGYVYLTGSLSRERCFYSCDFLRLFVEPVSNVAEELLGGSPLDLAPLTIRSRYLAVGPHRLGHSFFVAKVNAVIGVGSSPGAGRRTYTVVSEICS